MKNIFIDSELSLLNNNDNNLYFVLETLDIGLTVHFFTYILYSYTKNNSS